MRPLRLLLAVSLCRPAFAQDCPRPFLCEVEAAVARGLQWYRANEDGRGMLREDDAARGNFLAALAFMNSRPGLRGHRRGARGLAEPDRVLVRRLLRLAVEQDPGLRGDEPFVYTTGGNVWALATWTATGGADDLGARVEVDGRPLTATRALANGVRALHRHQGRGRPGNFGGWNYGAPMPEGDLSATLFATLGLTAAAQVFDGADEPLERTLDFLARAQAVDGGGVYMMGDAPSAPATAALLWSLRLARVPAGDPRAQRALRWALEHWSPADPLGRFGDRSAYHALWAYDHALLVSEDDGSGGALYAEDFGALEPATLGYPEEPPGPWFDHAWQLLRWQAPDGRWGAPGRGPRGWSPLSSHGFALMTLHNMPVFGPCADRDADGLCDHDDNCPDDINPEQSDADHDGLGEGCDDCPWVGNPDQLDADGDAIGDACDPYHCIPDGLPELCDGLDNDCDGQVDRSPDGGPVVEPVACHTGWPGRCAEGTWACVEAAVVCVPSADALDERCDGSDDDCDGRVDEGCEGEALDAGRVPVDASALDGATVEAPDVGPSPSSEGASADTGLGRHDDAAADEGERALTSAGGCGQTGGAPLVPALGLTFLGLALRRRAPPEPRGRDTGSSTAGGRARAPRRRSPG